MSDQKLRLLGQWDFEDGSRLEIRVIGPLDTRSAIDWARLLLVQKERELDTHPANPVQERTEP